MRTDTTARPAASQVFRPLPEADTPDIDPCELPLDGSPFTALHDATLLLTALEELEARRQAIERLREADLLRLILI
jgi:hypothetical protein